MKSRHTPILAFLVAIAIIAMVTISVQEVSGPRNCGSCAAFKKLTHAFEKAVIEAATIGDPGIIPDLLEQYNQDVRTLDFTR